MSKVKDKERILKAAREKQLVTYKGTSIRLSADFSAEICRPQGSGAISFQSGERKKPAIKTTLPGMVII